MALKSKKPKTKVKDRGYKRIIRELRKLENKPMVKVGYPEEKNEKDEKHAGKESGEDNFTTVLDIAVFHEFGTVHLPERSFVRAAFDKNRKEYENLNVKLLNKIYDGTLTVEKALDILGETILNDIKTFLTNNEVQPPSATEKTLVDTAQMLNALTYIKVMKP